MPKKTPTRPIPKKSLRKHDDCNYVDVIYKRRNELKQLHLLQESKAWPKWCWVLDETFELDGHHLTDTATGNPTSIYAWMEAPFKELYFTPLEMVHGAMRIWWGTSEKIITYLVNKGVYTPKLRPLVHNTTWAMLGYEANQCPKALDLAHDIFLDPTFDKQGVRSQYPSLWSPKDDITNVTHRAVKIKSPVILEAKVKEYVAKKACPPRQVQEHKKPGNSLHRRLAGL